MKYGIVYIWRDKKHKRYYIGSHWGTENDGYICSSTWMKAAYKRRPGDFKRRILALVHTTRQDMFDEESKWQNLISDDELKGVRYYNIRRHGDRHWSTDPNRALTIGQKISASPNRKANISKKAKQRALDGDCFSSLARQRQKEVMKNYKHSEETKKKISKSNMGRVVSQETREKIANAHIGYNKPKLSEEHKLKISSANLGRKHSEETKKKISDNGKGRYLGTVAVTDKNGINIRIDKVIFDSQKTGATQNWDFVSVSSKESKYRRLEKKELT